MNDHKTEEPKKKPELAPETVMGWFKVGIRADGEIEVEGSSILNNKVTMFGLIGCLNEMVLRGQFEKKQEPSSIIKPGNKGSIIRPR